MDRQKKFEEEYKAWIKSAAKDAAFVLKNLPYYEQARIRDFYKKYSANPAGIFKELQDKDRFQRLFGDRLKGILLLETEAVAFSTTIFIDTPEILDYAIAMNRRYFVRNLWFSIIAINSSFLNGASDIVLLYTIEHELQQKELYEEQMEKGARMFSPEEKRLINLEARRKAGDITGIGEEDLLHEKDLMLTLSTSCPLVPKYFTDISLYMYVVKHWEHVKQLGVMSRGQREEQMGDQLSRDFSQWMDFSDEIFRVFYREIGTEMEETGYV